MGIIVHEGTKTFHFCNRDISYVMMVLPNGHLGQLYYGKRVHDREDFSYLLEMRARPMTSCVYEEDALFSLEQIRQEYPVYGSTDYREPAVEIRQENGSRISDFCFQGYRVSSGKPALEGLPATYTEEDGEAESLTVLLRDAVTGIELELLYTIFTELPVITRSARLRNGGSRPVWLERAMSLSLDLPDDDYEWMQLSGAWARERHVKARRLEQGIQAIGSMRGNSSHEHNPFMALRRPGCDEHQGEVFGFSFVYSGNFQIQAEVDAYHTTRILVGIHPDTFTWRLDPENLFQTPEAVMVYADHGMNQMSQIFHRLFGRRLARGYWRDRPRPVLLNNWEATYFDFTEEKLVELAAKAQTCGVELFVLDDGWFGKRKDDHAGLGDWIANPDRLPGGITGLARKIEDLGMQFGLWFEPEMVNKDSDFYRAHPDWILAAPDRKQSQGRFQYVLDFSRQEVVDTVYGMMAEILNHAAVSYIKWDMNRSITECYSAALPPDRQGEVFHRYILGVYQLYARLTAEFPKVLFESCASGGGRFDPGILYYAPQGWTSDDTDAVERLKIQYGTSYCYPVSAMGAHVSAVPNEQVHRVTPLQTRANVACFGTFGYELDLNRLSEQETEEIKKQILFMKQYREVLQFGTFYRLCSPFEENEAAWMAVNQDKTLAILGWYRILNGVNAPYRRLRLRGLDPDGFYSCKRCYRENAEERQAYGDELMNIGMVLSDDTAGALPAEKAESTDFTSRLYLLTGKACKR